MFDGKKKIVNATGGISLPARVVPITYRSVYTVHRSGLGETAAEIAHAFEGACPEAARATGGRMPYTHVVRRDGTVEQALGWAEVAPHACAWNTRSASVGVVGDFRTRPPTDEQWESLVWLCSIASVLIGGASGVYGHGELEHGMNDPDKSCPGVRLDMTILRSAVRETILRLCHDVGMVW